MQFSVTALTLLVPNVVAHGYMNSIKIDGQKNHTSTPMRNSGDSPNGTPNPGVIRQVGWDDADITISSPDMVCGLQSTPAEEEAPAQPGSRIEFTWIGANETWPHQVGPILSYLADCGGDCSTFNGSDAKWFKIDQMGLRNATDWYVNDFHQGKSLYVTLPANLAAGHYLFRSELIALHTTQPEFYPACAQLSVGNSDPSSADTPNATVSFPGAYSLDDPGIRISGGQVYDPGLNYMFPGGPVSNVRAKDDSAGGKDLSGPNSAAHSSNAAPGNASTSPAPSTETQSTGSTSPTSTDDATTALSTGPSVATTMAITTNESASTSALPTTMGSAAAKATCASDGTVAQRKRMVDRNRRAISTVQNLRMARSLPRRRW